jgi:hypothetical protein
MTARLRFTGALAALIAACVLWPAAVGGQGAPRTPWGDPDLQGTYTNKYEQSTPLERPSQFEGRRADSTNFKDRSTYRNAIAATLRLVERFTRTARDRIEWAVTVSDPSTWTKPWTFSMPLTMNDAEPVLEFACHEGNYAIRHILSGARTSEATKGTKR